MSLVAVIGKGADCPEDAAAAAYKAGRAIAYAGHTVLTGALGGCMEAASRGAHDLAGEVVGLVPVGREPNPYVGLAIRTGLPEPFRNVVLAHAAEAAVVCAGGHGTRQELAFILERGIPVAQYGTSMWEGVEVIGGHDVDSLRHWLQRVLV